MPLNEFYQVRHLFMVQGEECFNIYHCRKLNPALLANDIASIFQNSVVTPQLSMEHALVTHISAECHNLGDALDLGGISLGSVTGTAAAGDLIAKFTAHSFRLQRARRDMRHGYKRLPGTTETQYANGIPTAAMVTLANTFMNNVLTVPWQQGGVDAVRHVVIKRIKYTTPTGKEGYRLPISDEELVYYDVSSASFHGLTTQNSRKY